MPLTSAGARATATTRTRRTSRVVLGGEHLALLGQHGVGLVAGQLITGPVGGIGPARGPCHAALPAGRQHLAPGSEDLTGPAADPVPVRRLHRREGGPEAEVTGEVTLGKVTKPITLEVEWGGVQEFQGDGKRHAGFSATGSFKRSEFDVAPGVPAAMLSDKISIELDIQLIEPTA